MEKVNLNISPESDSTLKKFGAQRMFSIPGIGKRLFSLHIKMGDGLRNYFFPDNSNRKVYIGYIGPLLRIASES